MDLQADIMLGLEGYPKSFSACWILLLTWQCCTLGAGSVCITCSTLSASPLFPSVFLQGFLFRDQCSPKNSETLVLVCQKSVLAFSEALMPPSQFHPFLLPAPAHVLSLPIVPNTGAGI